MALVLADRVRDTTTTTGTGTITLSGTAPTGYQNFSVVGNGNTTYYTINAASQWEVGIGTYSSTGPTLSRDTVLASSNGGALVNFSSGTKDVFVTYPAEKSVNYDDNGQVVIGVGGPSDTALLDVEGNIYAASAIRAGGGIDLPSGFGNYWRASLPSGAYQGGIVYNGGLRFYSGDVVTERGRFDTSGNLLVGTTAAVDNNFPLELNAGASSVRGMGVNNNGGYGVYLTYDNTGRYATAGAAIRNIANSPLYFETNNTLRATIDTSGNLLNYTSVRAPIFYDYDNTAYYVDPSSTSGSANFAGNLLFPDTSNTGIRNATGDAFLWLDDGYGNLFIKNTNGGFYGDFTGYHFRSASSVYWAYLYASYFQHETSVRSPIFYDSNDTSYYVDAASNTVLNTLYLRTGSIQAKFAQASQFGYSPSYRTVVLGNEYLTTISMGVDVSGNASGSFNGGGEGREILFRNGVNFITPNSANNSYLNPLNLLDGYAYNYTSMRSSIFYDSDNTGYYVDPAGSSNINNVTIAGTISIAGTYGRSAAGTGYLNGNYNSVETNYTTGPIYCINSSSYAPSASSLNSMYGIGYTDGANSGVWSGGGWGLYVAAGSGARVFLDGSNGIASATASLRAPIFYDSNNTAYFVDPHSTSVMSVVRADTIQFGSGNTAIELNNGMYLMLSDPSGYRTLYLGGSDPASYYNNNTHYFRDRSSNVVFVVNSSYGQHYSSLRAPIFYDSDNTGYYVNPAGTSYVLGEFQVQQSGISGLRIISGTGTQSLWVRAGYDTDGTGTPASSPYNIEFQSSGSSGGSFTFVSGNTKALTITSDYAQGAGSLRAPIFYDSNDTSYYCDPGNNSVFLNVQYGVNYTSAGGGGRLVVSPGSPYSLRQDFGSDNTGWRYGIAKNVSGTATVLFYVQDNGAVVSLGDMRAPIFYDSANTGYYVDPTGASYCYEYGGPVTYGSYGSISVAGSTNGYAGIAFPAKSSTLMMGDGGGTPAGFYFGNSAWGLYCYSAGHTYTKIVYDLDNTAYYVDPTGGSNFVGLTVANTINGSVSGGSGYTGYVTGTNLGKTGSQGFFTNTSWTAADWANLAIGGGGMTIYGTPGQPTPNYGFFMKIGNRDAGGPGWGGIWMDYYQGSLWYGNTTVSSSFATWYQTVAYGVNPGAGNIYAAVCYDTNDTGYYLDPNSTGISFRGRGQIFLGPNSSDRYLRLGGDGGTSDHSTVSTSNGNLHIDCQSGYGLYLNWYSAGAIWGEGGMYFPIYYDRSNTGFYVDPASTSYLNTVSMGAQTWRGDITWNSGVNVNVPASAECSFDVTTSGVWQVWDLTSSAPFIKCPAGSNVEIGQAGARGLYVYGSIYATGNVTAYSDASVKDNIKPITGALDKVASIGGYTFTRIDLPDTERVYGGVLAQEIETVLPEAVFEKGDKKSVDYNATIALLIEAIKELKSEVNDLKAALH